MRLKSLHRISREKVDNNLDYNFLNLPTMWFADDSFDKNFVHCSIQTSLNR